MQNPTVVIDGVQVILHDLNQPLSAPTGLYTVIVPNYQLEIGLSLGTTEITAQMSDHDIRSRIGSPYFLKEITEYLADRDIGVSSYENLIEQLQGSVREFDGGVAKLGRLYAKGQHMFAKMELNRIWSVDFRNKNYPTTALGFSDENTSLHGSWYINEDYNGEFFLTHKTNCLDRVTKFHHCGFVSSEQGGWIEQYIVEEFMARWGELMGDTVTENFRVAFDPSCLKPAPAKGFFDGLFYGVFDGIGTETVDLRPLSPLRNQSQITYLTILRRGTKTFVIDDSGSGINMAYGAGGKSFNFTFDPQVAGEAKVSLEKMEDYKIMFVGYSSWLSAMEGVAKQLGAVFDDAIVPSDVIESQIAALTKAHRM